MFEKKIKCINSKQFAEDNLTVTTNKRQIINIVTVCNSSIFITSLKLFKFIMLN